MLYQPYQQTTCVSAEKLARCLRERQALPEDRQ
jgi:hypothetical protein